MTQSAVTQSALRVWLVDPINYSGMAYYDAGLTEALAAFGVRATVGGSDRWLLPGSAANATVVPVFKGASGRRSQLSKGWHYLVGLTRLLRAIRKARPDIVHWQYLELPALDLLAIGIIQSWMAPVVYTAHEIEPWRGSAITRRLMRSLYSTVDAVVVHGARARAELLAYVAVPEVGSS